jgi:outer membrane protein OmpA-like peptidoglycan-associated protein
MEEVYRMKKIFAAILFVCIATFAYSDSLKTDKTEVLPGQDIIVTLSTSGGLTNNSWIGVIPSDVKHGEESTNDANDVDYQYFKAGDPKYIFKAPLKPGSYDFRLSSGGKELASTTFRVIVPQYNPKLTLQKTSFMPGDKIELGFKVDQPLPKGAWIGLIPSDVPHGSEVTNDQHDLTYQYVEEKTSGTFTFAAPDQSGSYDLRLNDSDSSGTEIASVTFTVGEIKKEGTLKLSKTSFLPGEQIELTFTASDTLPRSAWVGMIPSKVEHGKEDVNDKYDIQYQYVEKKTSGKMMFTAPPENGSYDFRLNSDDSGGIEITSVTFQVGGKLDSGGISKLLKEQGKLALYGIQFDFNQATIKPESAQVLGQVAEVLKNQPDLKLMIEGHTDNVGKPAYNMELSRKRAQSVKDYLIQNHQIDAARLSTQGFGDTKPMAKNDTEAGRTQNRRVELVKQ